MHIWMELYMWENRYRQFKDKKWNRTCGRRGTNQKVEPYTRMTFKLVFLIRRLVFCKPTGNCIQVIEEKSEFSNR